MPMPEWNRLRVEHPEWAAHVTSAAKATLPEGAELTVNRLRVAALNVPIPVDSNLSGGVATA